MTVHLDRRTCWRQRLLLHCGPVHGCPRCRMRVLLAWPRIDVRVGAQACRSA